MNWLCKFGFHRDKSKFKNNGVFIIETKYCERCERREVVTPQMVKDALNGLLSGGNSQLCSDILKLWFYECLKGDYKKKLKE